MRLLARSARNLWRALTSMGTALVLLFLLALAAVPGALLPQRSLNEAKVGQYILAHPVIGPWLERLQFFEVFSSIWFTAIYVLLFISLVGDRTTTPLQALVTLNDPVYVEAGRALGLRVRRGCSFHGLAFNVAMDLSPFSRINPCGYQGLRVTQVLDLGGPGNLVEVAQTLVPLLARQFGLEPATAAGELPRIAAPATMEP